MSAPDPKSESETRDYEKSRERQALSARAVHEALRLEGREELERRWSGLGWSGLAAGISMGLSLAAEGVLRAHVPDAPWAPLVTKLGYAVGFLAVTLGRQQLYTETTLTALLPMLREPSMSTLIKLVRLWGVVLAANLLGGLIFAAVAAHTSVFGPDLRQAFALIGSEAASHAPLSAFLKGIVGGWMIALMVWLLPSAEASRLWVIVILTWLLAAARLTHIIAGSVEVMYLVLSGAASWSTYVFAYAIPVLLGNTIGGTVFVAALNHAQVVQGER